MVTNFYRSRIEAKIEADAIANTAENAIRTFPNADLNVLAIGDYLVTKARDE